MKAVSLLLFVCLLTARLHAQTPSQARDFLDGIYSWDTNDQADDPLADAKAYTPSLIHLFAARGSNGEIGKLDFDPLCGCQDPGGLKYKITSLDLLTKETAHSQIALSGSPTIENSIETLTLDLQWTKSGWRINDVHTKEIPSLRDFLRKP